MTDICLKSKIKLINVKQTINAHLLENEDARDKNLHDMAVITITDIQCWYMPQTKL